MIVIDPRPITRDLHSAATAALGATSRGELDHLARDVDGELITHTPARFRVAAEAPKVMAPRTFPDAEPGPGRRGRHGLSPEESPALVCRAAPGCVPGASG